MLGWVQVVASRNMTGPVDGLDVVTVECRTIYDSDTFVFCSGAIPSDAQKSFLCCLEDHMG